MPKDLLPQDLDIHICGKDLPSSTFGGPVSSFAVLSKLDINTNLFEEVGRTEWIGKNCNPEFVNTIRIVYHFETVQVYRVVFYQSPLEVVPQDLSTIPVVGVAEFDVSQFVVADSISDGRKSLPLSTRGFAEIRVIVAVEDLNILQFKLKGTLHSNNWVQNPHPYLVISRLADFKTRVFNHSKKKRELERLTVLPTSSNRLVLISSLDRTANEETGPPKVDEGRSLPQMWMSRSCGRRSFGIL